MMWRPRRCAATLGPRRAVRPLQRAECVLLNRSIGQTSYLKGPGVGPQCAAAAASVAATAVAAVTERSRIEAENAGASVEGHALADRVSVCLRQRSTRDPVGAVEAGGLRARRSTPSVRKPLTRAVRLAAAIGHVGDRAISDTAAALLCGPLETPARKDDSSR
ncbi:hypothetical protein T492DRAFT_1037690 [Pavlovales sp. CCMP2436]|nr:hypothetical protein T492DRAFT_1037690 [Pavlovales sp. CCMP2436]